MNPLVRRYRRFKINRNILKEINKIKSDEIMMMNMNKIMLKQNKILEELKNPTPENKISYVFSFDHVHETNVDISHVRNVRPKDQKDLSPINRHDLSQFNKLVMNDDLKKHLDEYKHYYPIIDRLSNHPNPKFPTNPLDNLDENDPDPF
jgi:hypothetical protein